MSFTIIAQKMVFGGDCIAKIDGKTVFVPNLLPGETAEIDITEQKKDYARAIVCSLIKPSAHRTKPFCTYYGICGGCNFQHSSYNYQLELKKQILYDIFVRTFGLDAKSNNIIPPIQTVSGKAVEYRSRFQFHCGGLKERKGNGIVPIADCPCAVLPLRNFLRNDKKTFLSKNFSAIERLPVFSDERLLGENKVCFGLPSQDECSISILGKNLFFSAAGFFQSNMELLEKTIPLITEGLSGAHLLDMYSGTGVLSVFAENYFANISLVEENKQALSYTKKNFKKMPYVFALRGQEWIKAAQAKHTAFDAVIIDPPRSGIEKSVRTWLCAKKPPVIRSLSCNPASHARDAKILLEAGYCIERFFLLDFYPHTNHIESLIWFTLPPDIRKAV